MSLNTGFEQQLISLIGQFDLAIPLLGVYPMDLDSNAYEMLYILRYSFQHCLLQ